MMYTSLLYNRFTQKSRRVLILLLGLILIASQGIAQQNPLFTQYMFNGLVINPAYTGSHETMTLSAAYRSQWTGLNGAPQTQIASMHSPLKFTRSAAGAIFVHDHIGVSDLYTTYGTYAYRIPVSRNAKIALGAQVGLTYYRSTYADLTIITPNGQPDPAFAGTESRFLPNLGIGAYYYSKRSYVGISLPTLINSRWDNQDATIQARQKRHYFLSAGHVLDLGPNLKLKPNILLKWEESGPFQYDLNANLLIHEVIWVGFSYRWKDSVDGLLQWNITDQLSFGYSYGYPTSNLAAVQQGTHEVVLTYRVKPDKRIVFSPRYF